MYLTIMTKLINNKETKYNENNNGKCFDRNKKIRSIVIILISTKQTIKQVHDNHNMFGN